VSTNSQLQDDVLTSRGVDDGCYCWEVGPADLFFEHQPDFLGRLTARGLLYECVCVTPSFLHVASTYWKHASITSPLELPLVSVSTFLEGVLASPDSGQSGVLLSVMAPCLHFKPLDLLPSGLMFVFVRAQEDFLFWIPVHPMRLHRRHVFTPLRRDFVSAASPTRRSGACETWVPTGPHRPGSQPSPIGGPDLP
jgi:hypothetical protein